MNLCTIEVKAHLFISLNNIIMLKYKFIYLILFLFLLTSCSEKTISFRSDSFELTVNEKGLITTFTDKNTHVDYLENKEVSPLLAIRVNGKYENPQSMTFDKENGLIKLNYAENKASISIKVEEKAKYFTFEVVSIESDKNLELAIWGPYATTISQTIGECVGVVRDSSFAIGIQALNPKTIGGYPSTEDDVDPSYDIFATSSLVDVSDSAKVLYRGQTAKHTDFGSVIQAYCRNRDRDRIISMWKHDRYVAPAYNDGGIVGSKIALFGCPENQALDYLEAIELGENLPHPTLNGEWIKRTPEASQAYIIYPFNENNIEEAIEFTKQTGLKYLYHAGPFETWGHFKLNPAEFPSGLDGLKACVDKAQKEGIRLGIHTLSNFITTNDAYVTPVPDIRLAKVGSSILTSGIDAKQTSIVIESPDFFNQMENNSLHGIILGEELIRYESVSEQAPWTLLNCQRGAWGTTASAHQKNDTISKLMDHGYKTFLTNIDLTKEVARNVAEIFNKTGVRQISFDGLEGAWSTGLGQYGLSLFMKEWYDHLLPEYRENINDASMTTHYNWHTFTRMNWGEPWYAGFRESQMNYRLMNQDFYRRNLIPCMLGWFKFDANTSIEDIEWLLARSAAFDAGYTLVANKKNVEDNGESVRIIKAVREWENARLGGAFPAQLKKEMEHIANEYSLVETSNTSWELYPLKVQRFKHENRIKQPGEPVVSKLEFDNPNDRQPIQFIMQTTGHVSSIEIEIANTSTVKIDCKLSPNQYIKYNGGNECVLYDKNWNVISRIPIDANKMMSPKGKSPLIFSCIFSQTDEPAALISCELKTVGKPTKLNATRKRP